METTKIKKFLKRECAGFGSISLTRATLEKLADLLNDDDEILIESNGDGLSISSNGDILIEIA